MNDNIKAKINEYFARLPLSEDELQEIYNDPSAHDDHILRAACQNGDIDVVKYVLRDSRVDPAAIGNTPIQLASRGHIEIVKLLLADFRVDPSDCDNLAIEIAAYGNHKEIVALLLDDFRMTDTELDELCENNVYIKDEIKSLILQFLYRVDNKKYKESLQTFNSH